MPTIYKCEAFTCVNNGEGHCDLDPLDDVAINGSGECTGYEVRTFQNRTGETITRNILRELQ